MSGQIRLLIELLLHDLFNEVESMVYFPWFQKYRRINPGLRENLLPWGGNEAREELFRTTSGLREVTRKQQYISDTNYLYYGHCFVLISFIFT